MGTLSWNRFSVDFDSLNQSSQVSLIGGFGTLERLRRTIVEINLTLHNPSSTVVDPMIAYGAFFGLEIAPTSPNPAPLSGSNLGTKELIFLTKQPGRIITGNNNAIFYIAIPGDGRAVTMDTSVQRSGASGPFGVWLHWAFSSGFTPGTWNIRQTYTYSVLREVV